MQDDGVRPFNTGERAALAALSFLLVVTLVWWTFALWPSGAESNALLLRAREVCFGRTETGLPDSRGWLLLIGQPITMGIAIAVVWRESVGGALIGLVARGWGRAALVGVTAVLAGGALLASLRVDRALEQQALREWNGVPTSETRLDRRVPDFGLVDQDGVTRGPSDLRGRPALITFAFGHCETLCPITVQAATRVRDRFEGPNGPRVVVVTVDPWRDTPSRLPDLADQWGLEGPDLALSGEVDAVQAALEAFGVHTERDMSNGEITHPGRILLADAGGELRYAVPADPERIEELLRGL